MQIVPFADVDTAEWDLLAQTSTDAWLYHRSEWIAIEAAFAFPIQLSFLIRGDDGQDLAIMPLYFSELPLLRFKEKLIHNGIHRHTGLALRPGLGRGEIRSVQTAAIKEVLRVAEKLKADRIQLSQQNLAPANLPPLRQEIPFFVEDHHFYFGIKSSSQGIDPQPGAMTCNSDQIVFLDRDEPTLWDNLEDSVQRAIRKGQREGVEVVVAEGETYQDTNSLRKDAAQHTGQTLQPDTYYEAVRKLNHDNRQEILLARWKGQTIGAIELLVDKGSASYFGGFGLIDRLSLRYYDVLHWQAIRWCKTQGLRTYRLGSHFPDAPTDWQIYTKGRYKKKFGGQPLHVLQGSLFLTPDKYAAEQVIEAAKIAESPALASSGKGLRLRVARWLSRLAGSVEGRR